MKRPAVPVPVLVLIVALAVTACSGSGTPSATFSADDLTAVQEALALRGASVVNAVGGDAGCADATLHSNAVRLDLRLEGDRSEQQVYLFRWRRPAQFDAAAAAFAECAASFGGPTADAPETLEVPPWRAFGHGWTPELRRVLEDALRAAGGG